ncbi:PREDICTED: protein PF14_0175-like isoform X2 [Polistes canadensis]|uniref:protein PF14_0175-like isoform X2 n=1 Tax=Polistes canadensis TaxID=91411 RepID=UPI000718F741|nr:PREDICTED: protein PF14_0175-like isoform X2 [Polistes canadensis]
MEMLTMNSNNDSKAIDDNDELGKLKKNYLLLKRKICRTHELIRQYNDKVKECDRINIELNLAHTELKTLKTDYNGVLGKVIKLELQNTEYKKQITSMSSTTETQEIQIAGNQQHLNQLSSKLKEVEDKHADEKLQWEMEKSVLKDKIKEMEHVLKITKNSNSSIKKINKSQGIDKGTNCNFQNLISKVNVAVNTMNDSTITRADKNVITNLSFGTKKMNVYPLICDNCDSLFSNPIKTICKAMTKKNEMIEPIPPCREVEKDQKNDERVNFQNPSKDKSKSNNSTFELSKISALKEDQNSHAIKEELSVNLVQQTTTESLTHYMNELRNQMKRLEKKINKQSHKKELPDYNYFQPSPYSNYFHNDMLNYNSLLNLMSRVLNNVNETARSSKKIRKEKHESKSRKLILKKTKRKRVQKIVSASNDAWKVDSIVPCYKQIIRTDNSTSNNHLNRSPSLINNDLVLDDGSSNTNVEKDICRNNIIKTANDNISKSNSLNGKQCLSSTIIEEIQPVRDTRFILEPLNLKNNTFLQYKTIIVAGNDIINDLDPTSSIASVLSADISMNNKFNVSKKQINIPFTNIYKSDNTENTIEDISNPIGKVPIHVNTSDSTSNNTAINTNVKNRKRKLQTFENKLNQLNLIKDLQTPEKNNKSIHNIESTRETICEKKINSKLNVQIVNSDVVLKKKKRIIYEAEMSNQEISTLSNKNLNVIQEMDDEPVEAAQANILDCTSLNKKETKYIEKQNNNRKVPKKQDKFNIKKIPKSKCVFATNKSRTRLLGNINNMRSRRLIKNGNLKLFDSNEPITKQDESSDKEKCIPKPACNKDNKTKKSLVKSISELKAINKDLIEDLPDNTFNNETQIKLTDNSETLMENEQMLAANSISISTDINESTKDECFTTTMTPLKDSKLMQDEDALININEKAKRENIESCHKLISDEENKMIKSIYSDCSKFKLISHLKENYISKDRCEKSLKNNINEPIQNVAIKPQILNLNEIDTSIHSEYNIESQMTRLETSMFVEEEATAEILNRSIKETEEFNLESNNIDMKTEKIIEIPLDEEDNLIINAEEQHNSDIITTEKSNELIKDIGINNPTFELLSPLKDNQIFNDTCESSLENNLQNVTKNSRKLPVRGLGALIDSKHMRELKRIKKTGVQKQSKVMELDKINKDLSTSDNYKNRKVHAKMSKNSINTTKPNNNLNIQSHNAIINDLKVVSANSRVNNTHADNNNLNSLVNPIVLLENYLQQNLHPEGLKKSRQELKKQESLYEKIDKFVQKQLNKIVNNTDWAMPVHRDVVEKLSSTCSARIIAKGIVNFVLIRRNDNLDKTYTPPAPLMTVDQQKIVALLVDLEIKVPTVIKWVQAGIEFKIFRLNCTPTFYQIENLIRVYIALTRIQKDREKLRMLCCDALYCLGFSAVPIIYTVLTCWPEVFPQCTENTDMLPKCIAHCIMSLQANHLPQLQSLKNFLSMYFNYKKGSYVTKNLVEELLRSFERSQSKENTESLRTAVILLAKKEGVLWTHNNIIRSTLLPNIVGRKYAFVQEVFALLGNLMRTFPLEDKDGIVKNTVEQLADLLDSGEGPHDQQEGIASALLSLSRHDLMKVINTVLKWIPNEPLRASTMDQYSALFRLRTRAFWKKYLKSVEKKLTQIESKDHNVYIRKLIMYD